MEIVCGLVLRGRLAEGLEQARTFVDCYLIDEVRRNDVPLEFWQAADAAFRAEGLRFDRAFVDPVHFPIGISKDCRSHIGFPIDGAISAHAFPSTLADALADACAHAGWNLRVIFVSAVESE